MPLFALIIERVRTSLPINLPRTRRYSSASFALYDLSKSIALRRRKRRPAMGKGFDGARAAEVVAELRETFRSGRTRSLRWRAAQLKALARMIDENESDIAAALYHDLAKPPTESFLHEVLDAPSLKFFLPSVWLLSSLRWSRTCRERLGSCNLSFLQERVELECWGLIVRSYS